MLNVYYNGPNSPFYATDEAAGADLLASISGTIEIKPLQRALIPTGLRLALPCGYEAQVRPRSGLALNHGVTLLNSPGTIDSDYRGEIKVLLINLSTELFIVTNAMRIAQLVIAPVVKAHFIEEQDLLSTARGLGGFGSTGE